MKGLAYDGADQAIGHGGNVKDDGLQFVVIDFAVSQNRFISLLGYDSAYENACVVIIAGAFTFKCDRKFFDNRGIDMKALVDVAACFFYLIHLVARFYAKVIGNVHRIFRCEGNRKGLGVLDVVRRLVLCQKERDFTVIRLGTPGRIHGIGYTLFIICPDDEYPFRRDARLLPFKLYTHQIYLLINYSLLSIHYLTT